MISVRRIKIFYREQESSSDQQLDELLKCKRKSEADRVEICALKYKKNVVSRANFLK